MLCRAPPGGCKCVSNDFKVGGNFLNFNVADINVCIKRFQGWRDLSEL